MSVKDHRCSAGSQVPNTANGIKTTVDVREHGIPKTNKLLTQRRQERRHLGIQQCKPLESDPPEVGVP